MNTDHKFLAFDLGATSGRAIVGGFEDGKFSMEEIHRFPNGAQVKCGCFHWNTDELFGHIKAGLKRSAELGYKIESIGIDTWGVDFGAIGADGRLLSGPGPTGTLIPRAFRKKYSESSLARSSTESPVSR